MDDNTIVTQDVKTFLALRTMSLGLAERCDYIERVPTSRGRQMKWVMTSAGVRRYE